MTRSMAIQKMSLLSSTTLASLSLLAFSSIVSGYSWRSTQRIQHRRSQMPLSVATNADNVQPLQQIVLIGGGHAHVQVIKALHRQARGSNVNVVLIDTLQSACYSGMVPGSVVGSYDPQETLIDLKQLAEWASIDFVHDTVVDVDFDLKHVFVSKAAEPIPFDVVSFDIGSVSRDLDRVPGAFEHSIPTRPIHKLVGRLEQAMENYEEIASPNLVVVGGGIAGIELAMTVTTRWQENFPETTCTILNAGPVLLPDESALARGKLQQLLKERRIRVKHNALVKEVNEDSVELFDTAETIPFSLCLWATGAGVNPLARHLSSKRGMESTEHGWFKVHPTLQSTSYPFVFCAGDCCSIQGLERGSPPKAGVYAVRAGPILIDNIIATLKGQRMINYEPQDDFWKLIVCNRENAIGFRFGLAIHGPWVWQLKDHIDRQFMQLFDVRGQPPPTNSSLDTSQYDDVDEILSTISLNPSDGATLISRTDDSVDYMKAWAVLRAMARDIEYRKAIQSHLLVHAETVKLQ